MHFQLSTVWCLDLQIDFWQSLKKISEPLLPLSGALHYPSCSMFSPLITISRGPARPPPIDYPSLHDRPIITISPSLPTSNGFLPQRERPQICFRKWDESPLQINLVDFHILTTTIITSNPMHYVAIH